MWPMFYFQHKTKPENMSRWVSQTKKLVPASLGGWGVEGGRHSFQEGKNAQLATCWNCNHVLVFLLFCYQKWHKVNDPMWSYRNDLSPRFRTNYSESQALGLGKQRWVAAHSGEGYLSLWGRRREAGLYSLEASALMSLLIVSSWFFV